jgi:anti-sigma factor RsiW
MQCAESLRVQAHFDGELDAVSAAAVEQHVELCAECRALLQDLEQMRAAIRRDLTHHRASPALRARIERALDDESATQDHGAASHSMRQRVPSWRSGPGARRPFWAGALSGMGLTAAAATAAFLLMSPNLENAMVDDLAAAHARSLMPSHLIDVESTDQHTVKPWFAGHADVSPVVADFAQRGYRLVGGRADYLGHQRSAAVVYRHGAHIINVFSWSGSSRVPPASTTRLGFRMAFWRVGDLQYCAVSDAGWEELMGLVRLLQQQSASDAPE